ncbi:ABC transporter permease [Staphylococcus aureus]|nr:ABC transporter permease [Staphylococcus aureus]
MFIIKSMLYRLMQMIVVLFVISTLTFILMKLSPGNPVDKILHLDVAQVSTEQINATKDKLGLNDSLLVQWWHWMNHLLHFNLGKSFESKEPVTQILFNYAPITLLISFSTLVVSLCISIPLGIIAAKRFHKWTDKVIRVISTLSISLPAFFIGIILLFIVTNLMNIPGIGYLLMDSIKSRDYPVIQGCVLFIGFFVVIINTIADLLTLLLDPKQRLQLGNPKIKTNTPLISVSSDRHA